MLAKKMVLVVLVAIMAAGAFFLDPMAVTAMVYDRETMNAAGFGEGDNWVSNPDYNSDFHYGYYFPVEFTFAEQIGDFNCAIDGDRIAIGSLIALKCGENGWKVGWVWYYVLRQDLIQIASGNPIFVDVFMGYKYLLGKAFGQ